MYELVTVLVFRSVCQYEQAATFNLTARFSDTAPKHVETYDRFLLPFLCRGYLLKCELVLSEKRDKNNDTRLPGLSPRCNWFPDEPKSSCSVCAPADKAAWRAPVGGGMTYCNLPEMEGSEVARPLPVSRTLRHFRCLQSRFPVGPKTRRRGRLLLPVLRCRRKSKSRNRPPSSLATCLYFCGETGNGS